jgi:hypothetical protein
MFKKLFGAGVAGEGKEVVLFCKKRTKELLVPALVEEVWRS